MLTFGIVIGALIVAAGLITYWLAPRVGPNPIFGVRIGYAYASREIWDRSNRFGGALMVLVGVGTAILGLTFALLGVPSGAGVAWLTTAMIAAFLGALVWMYLYARSLAQGTPIARRVTPVAFRWTNLAPVLLSFALLVAALALAYPLLPATRMATHFGIDDRPDGWMSRDAFVITFAGMGALFVAFNAFALVVATREPLIAMGRWGRNWRLDPERGLVYLGLALALGNLLFVGVFANVVWYNTRGALLYPFAVLLLVA
ncbi:MAG: SdpI family protein, partial [Chloroflexi bacterium]|nr:SdpI family protein [Chloroflexota bacterium]